MRSANRVRAIQADRNDPIYQKLGARLTELRQQMGWTQGMVAEELGLTQSAVTYYEKGRSRVPLGVFVRWCEVLGYEPGYVLATARSKHMMPRQDGRRKDGGG